MINSSNAKVGDKIYIPEQKRPYTIRARDERYIIATKPFNPKHTVLYFIIDLIKGWRGPDDRIFCSGYESDEDVHNRLTELQKGEIELSYRHSLKEIAIEKIVPRGRL